ncbi:MAG: hypothetical protein JNM99_25325 [Verrucomicrobiaceae bacterium]|nr:hypothetical protein [Verrucomicrobiaceae bacterium]
MIVRIPKPEPLAPINAEPIRHAASADLKPIVLVAMASAQEHLKVLARTVNNVAVNLAEITPIKAVLRGVLKAVPAATNAGNPAISIVPKVANRTLANNIRHVALRTHAALRVVTCTGQPSRIVDRSLVLDVVQEVAKKAPAWLTVIAVAAALKPTAATIAVQVASLAT